MGNESFVSGTSRVILQACGGSGGLPWHEYGDDNQARRARRFSRQDPRDVEPEGTQTTICGGLNMLVRLPVTLRMRCEAANSASSSAGPAANLCHSTGSSVRRPLATGGAARRRHHSMNGDSYSLFLSSAGHQLPPYSAKVRRKQASLAGQALLGATGVRITYSRAAVRSRTITNPHNFDDELQFALSLRG